MNNTASPSGGGMRGDKIPKGYKASQLQQFTPEQMQLFQSMFSHLGPDSYLSRLAGGDEEMFNEMEAPAMRQFSELQGNMGSRFSQMGMGAQKSSGFKNTMSQAGSNFAQDLQSRRQELQRNAIKDLMGMSNELLGQKPYERQLVEKSKPWWQELAIGAGQGFGQGLGKSAGEGVGNMFSGAAIPAGGP
jgi:hypothetical protein